MSLPIGVLTNNARLALGAPNTFPVLNIEDVDTIAGTNVNSLLFKACVVLNQGQAKARARGTILNTTSTTLEVPPFPCEPIYHASKTFQEGLTNAWPTELVGTDIKVLALRMGVVATNFHELWVCFDRVMYEEFMEGFGPLLAGDMAEVVAWMVDGEERISVRAVDVVPSAQRSLSVFDEV
ncbi:hypothetical protein K458DRAFT_433897 [Lentithecium fluviatile CBS 122367]|uniref:NAD(P)-binding protein n=1 Tax=Lentithecium fluviatile CBS 122367 TaxID=1168545 RepID=A0A6G1ISR4_9PLEO|nr:hypothetical protein K458DRAFT_433897 [Lentithecium fluviatile CBS 122367]